MVFVPNMSDGDTLQAANLFKILGQANAGGASSGELILTNVVSGMVVFVDGYSATGTWSEGDRGTLTLWIGSPTDPGGSKAAKTVYVPETNSASSDNTLTYFDTGSYYAANGSVQITVSGTGAGNGSAKVNRIVAIGV